MAETSNYQLNQWEKTDRIQMEDFNADNLKTDQALAKQRDEITALTAAVALCGNCGIEQFSYVGTGNCGDANPTIFRFSTPPNLFFVLGGRGLIVGSRKRDTVTSLVFDLTYRETRIEEYSIIWTQETQAAYALAQADYQMNEKGQTYWVYAFSTKTDQ